MRQLTRDQIEKIGPGIDKVLIGHGRYHAIINIMPECDKYNLVREYLKKERENLEPEARQHLDYLTSHPTVLCEVSFP